ncbi:putative ribonuclease H protein [Trifolium medium]|uniref:Putative ribonuclease H protein n=1 Tax=Trifolium medium TaxID=97028 RepID=A0A392MAG6_9FABA|nr:putative ribonuclease H protein [Trifolium medium]
MSSILLPETLGDELEKMINSFWWGSNKASGKGINWLRWEKLTMRKEHGGMGFRHLYGFNLTMLGKQGDENMTVANLVNYSESKWHITKVQQLFNQEDAAAILQIPLQFLNEDDVLIWRFSRNGNYSVRSDYYHLMEVVIENNHLKVEGNWNKMWKLNIPKKVKIFLWRSLRECLPVKERLIRKGVQCDPKCPCCDLNTENEWHCFFGCKAAQEVWIEVGMWDNLHQQIDNAAGYKQLVFHLLDNLQSTNMAQIVMTLWMIHWQTKSKMLEQHATNDV